jgi:hypothetical protein
MAVSARLKTSHSGEKEHKRYGRLACMGLELDGREEWFLSWVVDSLKDSKDDKSLSLVMNPTSLSLSYPMAAKVVWVWSLITNVCRT